LTWQNKLPCPHPDCSSSDAFGYNTEEMGGNCFSCGNGYPLQGVQYAQEWIKKYPTKSGVFHQNEGAKTTMTRSYLPLRGITSKTMEVFGVHTETVNGKPAYQTYTYPSGGVKTRFLEKKGFKTTDGFRTDELWGMNLFTSGASKTVTITEGELDAMSVYQMVNTNPRFVNPVVSLPSASTSAKLWPNVKKWLDGFEKIILSVDNDGPGGEVAAKINNLFPSKVYRVDHSKYKDANDFLMAGKAQEFANAWWNAQRYVPENILHSADDFLELFDHTPDHTFVPTGIAALDAKIMGLMQGHFTVLKAPTGIGKTELMRYLEHNMLQRGVPFATWHLEETKLRSILGLVSYDLKDNMTRKDLIEEKGKVDEVRKSIAKIAGGGTFYQFFLQEHQGADDLIAQIRLMREGYGCKFVFFEPIQDVITTSDESSKESALAELAIRLSKVAADLNVGIVTIAHTNENGDVKYCKMIGQRASVIIDIKRDKDSEDVLERNTTKMYIEKNRPTSLEGFAGEMLFDLDSFTMSEM
jgi:hypothetical protein